MLELKVNVQIGVTPEVVSLVSAILNKPAAVEAPAEVVGDMPDEVFYPQEEDIRTAMHVARQRIEGEDYKDKPSDDLHRAVTDVFKAIVNDLSGQKKPSALPQEKRQSFIDATRTIQQGANGQFTYTVVKQ